MHLCLQGMCKCRCEFMPTLAQIGFCLLPFFLLDVTSIFLPLDSLNRTYLQVHHCSSEHAIKLAYELEGVSVENLTKQWRHKYLPDEPYEPEGNIGVQMDSVAPQRRKMQVSDKGVHDIAEGQA